jgi:hypothetical protein
MIDGRRRIRRHGGAPRGPAPRGRATRGVRICSLALLLGALLSSTQLSEAASEQRPRAVCHARLVDDRVVTTIELQGLLDEDLLALIRLGLEGRISVEASVFRNRWGFFEQDLATHASEARVGFSSDDRTYVLDGRSRIRDPARFTMGRIALQVSEAHLKSRMTFRAEIRLQVVTESSLAKVVAWVTDSNEEETSGSIVSRGLLSAVAKDLVRTAECSCAVEKP